MMAAIGTLQLSAIFELWGKFHVETRTKRGVEFPWSIAE